MNTSFWSRVVRYFAARRGQTVTRTQIHADFRINPKQWNMGTPLDRYRLALEDHGYLTKGPKRGTYKISRKKIPLDLKTREKPKKPRGPFWTTAQGVKLAVQDMGTDHIKNCLKHLEARKLQHDLTYASLPEPNGEMASYAFEQEIAARAECEVGEVFPIYKAFEKELERRAKREAKRKR